MLQNLNIPNPFAKETRSNGNNGDEDTNRVPPKVPDQQNSSTGEYLERRQQEEQSRNPDNPDNSGFDKWKDLYETEKDEKGNPIEYKDEGEEISLSMSGKGYNTKNIKELASKVNVPMPEDEEISAMFENKDVDSFKNMLQSSMRSAFQMAVMTSAKGADDVFADAGTSMRESSKREARNSLLESEVNEVMENEFPSLAKNPSFKSAMDDVRKRIQRKNPDASPRKVASMLSEYVEDNFSMVPESKKKVDREKQDADEVNWLDM